ncbi:lecithin retinol acyltransferase family protein [Cupriavidus sp. 30B13]|uniref:lecithin retinol acyltransferase family protein n=1 Tax=Cupriavidus sp. 30B13 TaxID=3384241 RepID=UPI003B91C363
MSPATPAPVRAPWHDGPLVPLAPGSEPPLAAHLIIARSGYWHHGIYVGHGKVVHYAGLVGAWRSGPVEEIPLARFAAGQALWMHANCNCCFDAPETIRRARSRLGECRYKLLTNNCEHFCNWCLTGTSYSAQVRCCLRDPLAALRAAFGLLLTIGGMHRFAGDGA